MDAFRRRFRSMDYLPLVSSMDKGPAFAVILAYIALAFLVFCQEYRDERIRTIVRAELAP